ncbi:MAG: ribonuclease G [Rugosibacter sp.]|nr:MAG: ribonuclease G [Rugosibacter sp.]
MAEEFLINFTPEETRVASLQQGVVQELHIERNNCCGVVGNIYLGRVVRVLPGMQSAFVDIGLERSAFLHAGDIWEERVTNGAEQRPIEQVLSAGQSLCVQVQKEPIGTKGARLTTQISIAGRLLVYLPQDDHVGISQRIVDEEAREKLRGRIQALLSPEDRGGFILRTVACEASDEDLAADIVYLRRIWQEIKQRSVGMFPPVLLHHDLTLAQRVLRDFVTEETTAVLIDSRENFQKLKIFAQEYVLQVSDRLVHYTGDRPLFELHGIDDEIQKALARRVDLKSGGYLIFDQTEAMTTIDVNTGGFVGVRNFNDTIFKTNLEAALAVAHQLRLRNLGGIIIVDFIDMDDEQHQAAVLAEFKKALASDRTRITLSEFTQLGLIEMTRKRTRESLAQILCEPCPVCSGRGEIKTAQTVCYEILRELLREARQFAARELRVIAAPVVIDKFLEEEAQALTMLSDFIGRPVSLHPESGYTQEQFDIVLM